MSKTPSPNPAPYRLEASHAPTYSMRTTSLSEMPCNCSTPPTRLLSTATAGRRAVKSRTEPGSLFLSISGRIRRMASYTLAERLRLSSGAVITLGLLAVAPPDAQATRTGSGERAAMSRGRLSHIRPPQRGGVQAAFLERRLWLYSKRGRSLPAHAVLISCSRGDVSGRVAGQPTQQASRALTATRAIPAPVVGVGRRPPTSV